MKLQVIVKSVNKAATTSTTIDADVRSTDKVFNVKEFVASAAKIVSFPDQELIFKDKVLLDTQILSECGIKDGDMLELSFQASEEILVRQISDLLGEKGMSPAELSLLYSYRYGASLEDAFKALGCGSGQICTLLENHKHFYCQGGLVKIATKSASQQAVALKEKPADLIKVSVCIDLQTRGKSSNAMSWDEDEDVSVRLQVSRTVAKAMDVIAGLTQMPFLDRDLFLDGKKLDHCLSLDEAGVKNGSALVMAVRASENSLAAQLEELLQQRVMLSANDLGLLYCQRYGTPIGQALRILGLKANLGQFLESQDHLYILGGCVSLHCDQSFGPMEGFNQLPIAVK